MSENCDKVFVPRCNEEIWNGESILNSHLKGKDIILQQIKMQTSKAISATINVSDLFLKIKDSELQGVRANAYQLYLNNLMTGTVDSTLLIGDNLAGRIKSLNNIKSLMKPAKMMNKREVFGKNQKNFQPF